MNARVKTTDISATGTPSNTTYLRGDGSWSVPAGTGGSGIWAPLCMGTLPGPDLVANADGSCIMVEI